MFRQVSRRVLFQSGGIAIHLGHGVLRVPHYLNVLNVSFERQVNELPSVGCCLSNQPTFLMDSAKTEDSMDDFH
jgi:hypothetical protein